MCGKHQKCESVLILTNRYLFPSRDWVHRTLINRLPDLSEDNSDNTLSLCILISFLLTTSTQLDWAIIMMHVNKSDMINLKNQIIYRWVGTLAFSLEDSLYYLGPSYVWHKLHWDQYQLGSSVSPSVIIMQVVRAVTLGRAQKRVAPCVRARQARNTRGEGPMSVRGQYFS